MDHQKTQKYQTENPYESKFGYSRAIRHGPFIFVSGTTSIDTSTHIVLHPTSAHKQAIHIFNEIIKAVESLGGKKEGVTRIRMFVKRDEDCEQAGAALKEVFAEVGPAATMISGVRFVDHEMKVEIEADAVVL